MLEDEQTQIHGVIEVLYFFGDAVNGSVTSFVGNAGPIVSTLPFRGAAMHFCFNQPGLKILIDFIQLSVGKDKRMRFRTHSGSETEVKYSLLTFGIGVSNLPINEDGSLNLDLHTRFIRERRIKEEWEKEKERSTNGPILYPSRNDVLLGRGKPYQSFPGNLELARVVDSYQLQYTKATERLEKHCIAAMIVKIVQDSGGRFMKRTSDGWKVEDDQVACCKKVSHTFRNQMQQASSNGGDKESDVGFFQSNKKRIRYDANVVIHDDY